MAHLKVPQCRLTAPLNPEISVMRNLLALGIPVASSCGGEGICGRCKMEIFSSDALPEKSDLEKKTLEKNKASEHERLSCQLSLNSDIEVKTTYW